MSQLQVQKLTKRYRRVPVVNEVSFSVNSGEVTGYLGPNGSGKSTTVKMLTGLVEPSTGQILLDGADVQALGRRIGGPRKDHPLHLSRPRSRRADLREGDHYL